MSPDEQQRCQRLRFPIHQRRQLAACGMLRRLLADVLNCAPESLRFERQEHGKPALPGRPMEFNLSHSEGYAVLAVQTAGEVGVDVEDTGRSVNWASLAPRYFAASEARRLAGDSQPQQLFFATWTAKEAYIKAIGSGLFLALDQFVTFRQDTGWGLYDLDGGTLPWRLKHLKSPFERALAAWVGPPESPDPRAYRYGPEGQWLEWP